MKTYEEMLDDNGQPLNRLYGRKRMNDRAIDELIGLARGITADGTVNHKEAKFLCGWMKANVEFCEDTTINQIYRRIHEMLIDGALDSNEQIELLGILREFSGESTVNHCENMASTLPLCKPLPHVVFPGKMFCLTGKFAYGPRKICEEVVTERGGNIHATVVKNLDFLVIGTFSSREWAHTSYGRKIEKAIENRENAIKYSGIHGMPSIISEDHWAQSAFYQV